MCISNSPPQIHLIYVFGVTEETHTNTRCMFSTCGGGGHVDSTQRVKIRLCSLGTSSYNVSGIQSVHSCLWTSTVKGIHLKSCPPNGGGTISFKYGDKSTWCQSLLHGIHRVALGCAKRQKWELERNSNLGSFLTSSQLANQGVKWVWMSDCGFRKERKKKEGVVLCVKSEIDESFFPPTVWHSLLLLFAPVEKKRRKKKKKPKHSTVTNPTPHDHLSMTHNGSDSF